jgi:hypothetical protein
MRKTNVVLICSLFVWSCTSHYSGRLTQTQDVTVSPGTVPYRAGTVPYRNDGTAAARKEDALKKIAKFCGSDDYTVTGEGSSPTEPNMSEVSFRCGQGAVASASAAPPPQPNSSGTPGGTHITVNPNVAPPDFDHP